MNPRKMETTSSEAAADAALAMAREHLRIMGEKDIRKRHEKLTHAWAGELFTGSTAEIGALLTWNLRRISREADFQSFVVRSEADEGFVDTYADLPRIDICAYFPRAVVCVEVWRTESAFFVFGNRLFTNPKRETVLGRLAKLFKPDPRTAEIRRLRSLIKKHYGKGEIISYLLEVKKLGDPLLSNLLSRPIPTTLRRWKDSSAVYDEDQGKSLTRGSRLRREGP